MPITDIERARRLEAAHKYIDTSENGWLFSKADLRCSSKTFYFVPFEYQHKTINDIPEEVLRIMAYQGHRRRNGKEEESATNTSEEKGEEVHAPPGSQAGPSTSTAPSPSGPAALKKALPGNYDEMLGKMNDALTNAVQQIIAFGNKSHTAIREGVRASEEALKEELATAKRRIAELEEEAAMFHQIAEIVTKKPRTS